MKSHLGLCSTALVIASLIMAGPVAQFPIANAQVPAASGMPTGVEPGGRR